jgi:signal peptidase I
LQQLLITVLLVFLIHEVFTSLVIRTAEIGSRSMLPTVFPGDAVFISRLPYGMTVPFTRKILPPFRTPSRGDVVLLDSEYGSVDHVPLISDLWSFFSMNSPVPGSEPVSWERGVILRRVIAIGGDRVYLSGGKAWVQIAGTGDFLIEELIIDDEYSLNLPAPELNRPDLLKNLYTSTVTVPEGMLFLLPDNRAEAVGSPSFGFVPAESMRGRVTGFLRRAEQ